MRYTTVGGEGMGTGRRCNVTPKEVYCPNAYSMGYCTKFAEPGHWIEWEVPLEGGGRSLECGRVLGRISSCDQDGEDCTGHILALWLICGLSSCGIFWIDPEYVVECRPPSPDLLDLVLRFPITPHNIKAAFTAVRRGELCESYIDQARARFKEQT